MGKMCPNCGNILSDQAKFCPKCGTKQETQTRQEGKFCLFCGATLEPGARFCSSCGRDLMAAKKGNGGAVHSNVSAADYVKSTTALIRRNSVGISNLISVKEVITQEEYCSGIQVIHSSLRTTIRVLFVIVLTKQRRDL